MGEWVRCEVWDTIFILMVWCFGTCKTLENIWCHVCTRSAGSVTPFKGVWWKSKGGPFQNRFLTLFKFKNELYHWTRLSFLMKIEWSFVKFGPRVPLFSANLGYFGSILAIFNMVQFLSRWNFLNEFCCKFLIFSTSGWARSLKCMYVLVVEFCTFEISDLYDNI